MGNATTRLLLTNTTANTANLSIVVNENNHRNGPTTTTYTHAIPPAGMVRMRYCCSCSLTVLCSQAAQPSMSGATLSVT